MKEMLAKFGIYRGRKDPAVLFVAHNATGFASMAGLIDEFCDRGLRLDVVLLCLEEKDLVGVQKRFERAKVVPAPAGGILGFSGLLSTLNARVVIALDELPKEGAKAIAKRSTPLINAKEARGRPIDELIDHIVGLAGRERRWEERRNRPLGRFFAETIHAKLVDNDGVTGLTGSIQRYNDIDQLGSRLSNPEVIMCLGNGPSSEDSGLINMDHDVLFRANHVWMTRGYLDQPDVVFTGMQASMNKVVGPILAVLGDTTEKVLLMVRAKNFVVGKLEYCVAGGSSALVELDVADNFRPTSGAVMLSVAVALHPKKLIVAGMDMFRHPDGAYPDDATTTNAYTATHDHDRELDFILKLFERFEGQLQIVSPVLEAEWSNYQKTKGQSG